MSFVFVRDKDKIIIKICKLVKLFINLEANVVLIVFC